MEAKKLALVNGVSREIVPGFETAKQLATKRFNVSISAFELEKVVAAKYYPTSGFFSDENSFLW